MSERLFTELSWLPKPPVEFRSRCRAAVREADRSELIRLSRFALDEVQLQQLARAAATLDVFGKPPAGLTPFKLGIVGNATLEPLVPALTATSLRHGIALRCTVGAYAQAVHEALDATGQVNREKPDAVLLAFDFRGLPLDMDVCSIKTSKSAAADALEWLQRLRSGFHAHGDTACILQTVAPPPETLFGNLDRAISGTIRNLSATFNAALIDDVSKSQDVIFDVAALAETVGLSNWHSPKQWHLAKFPFDAKFLPLYADHISRIIAAMRGKSRRCLILDLDNTIWGGVIGDDGLEGIVIGQGDATGEAYLDVQAAALALRDRGIVLAVSSKNDDDVARAAFLRHPEMLLRENHVAVFQANWNDKAVNIRAIAAELSLGLDSIVFMDDNRFERELIRSTLPDVAVPELPEDPALYSRTLAAAGYFESISFSDEDRRRSAMYEDNARRATLAKQMTDVSSYLEALQMEIVFAPFDRIGRARIAQLINKSNQFNLTTRRYGEAEIEAFEKDASCVTLQVRLLDAFGDNGMISVVICRPRKPNDWEIDTWLMSCRVLGRGVERMVLREILHHARRRGIEKLIGVYLRTERNKIVEEHYARLGFRFAGEVPSGTMWELHADAEVEPAPMNVRRLTPDLSTAS
ncbi:MAG: HAD family hydrolase [Acidobacteriaceae bacterium]|nr:HAD family hydrolase [Acidobacteriaceae bacterium]MBV9972765.1 HAD family hydrolase [Candidatus Eremiobacteraeota bacterium]